MKINKDYIDPSYLRYIYDGLNSGNIHAENASSLPEGGLIGIYEEALPPEHNVKERKRFIEFFGVLAITKKEISLKFLLTILENCTELEANDFINQNSKWLNSTVSGMFHLYHERLKVYLYQKISETEMHYFLKKIVAVLIKGEINKEHENHKYEFLGHYLFALLISNYYTFNQVQKILFNQNFIEKQYEFNPSGDWVLTNLKQSLRFSDFTNTKNNSFLLKVWLNSTKRIRFEKKTAFKDFIYNGRSENFINLFSTYSDYNILFEEIIWCIKGSMKKGEFEPIKKISTALREYFPENINLFSWNNISDLNENYLLDLCYDLNLNNTDFNFISQYGFFNADNLISKFISINKGISSLPFFEELLKKNSIEDRSQFYFNVYILLKEDELLIFELNYSSLIVIPYFRYKFFVVMYDFNLSIILNDEFTEIYNRLNFLQKIAILTFIYSKQSDEIIKQKIKDIERAFFLIENELLHQVIDPNLTEEEAFIEKDYQIKRLMLLKVAFAKIISKIEISISVEIIESVILKSNEIKNGGVKSEALSLVQNELSGHNKIFEELGVKAATNIPRVPLGGLSYGQYEASNLIELSENNWELNDKINSYKYLLKAEAKIIFIEDWTSKDEVSLRLVVQYLKHKKKSKALCVFDKMLTSEIRIVALKCLCYYFIENDSKRLTNLMTHTNSKNEKRIILKLILYHLKNIDFQKYNELLLKYLSLKDDKKINSQIDSFNSREENYKLPSIQLNINKTYPPFFTLLQGKLSQKNMKYLFCEMSDFQKLYFSKDENLIKIILSNNDRSASLKLGESVFSKLLNIVKVSDFDSFKNETINLNNKFHVILLIKQIIRYAKKPYLFIDQLEKQLDIKLFYLCFESVVYNNKLNKVNSRLDKYNNYQITKVLRSERIANLIVNK